MVSTVYRGCFKQLSTEKSPLPSIADVFTVYRGCLPPSIADGAYRLSRMRTSRKPLPCAASRILNTHARITDLLLTLLTPAPLLGGFAPASSYALRASPAPSALPARHPPGASPSRDALTPLSCPSGRETQNPAQQRPAATARPLQHNPFFKEHPRACQRSRKRKGCMCAGNCVPPVLPPLRSGRALAPLVRGQALSPPSAAPLSRASGAATRPEGVCRRAGNPPAGFQKRTQRLKRPFW